MSLLTIFLGKLLGLYCVVVALAMMANKKSVVAKALQYEKLFFIYMGVTLALGLYLTIAGFSA